MNKLTMRDMMYWTEPTPAPVLTYEWDKRPKVLVTEYRTKRAGQEVGDLVPVKGTYFDRGRIWYVSVRGDYVYGPLEGAPNGGYCYVVVPLSPTMWALGSVQARHTTRPDVISITHVSDPKGEGRWITMLNGFAVSTNHYFKAAGAYDNMPLAAHPDALIEANYTDRKQKWEHDWRKGQILIEGMQRDWLQHLSKIRTKHSMPYPRISLKWEGNILYPNGQHQARTEISGDLQRGIERLEARSQMKFGQAGSSFISLSAEAILPGEVNTPEELRTLQSAEGITRAVRDMMDNWDLQTSTTQSRPVFMGAIS